MTKAKHYLQLRNFACDLLNEISVDSDPSSFLYESYIDGYVRGLIESFRLDKSEASNIRTEASEIKNKMREKVHQVQDANRYREAFDYCIGRLVYTELASKVLHSATPAEIIHLAETGWHSQDICDLYDEYEALEQKYLKKV